MFKLIDFNAEAVLVSSKLGAHYYVIPRTEEDGTEDLVFKWIEGILEKGDLVELDIENIDEYEIEYWPESEVDVPNFEALECLGEEEEDF